MPMTMFSPTARAALLVAGPTLALTVAGAAVDRAHAQAKLTANYTISVARIPVGKITWSTDIGDDTYTSAGSGEASGIASFLASGKGALSTRGTVKDGQLSPTEFTSDITQDDEKGALKMVLDQGAVTELKSDAPAAGVDRVPVTATHQQGVVDPLTAWLIPGRRRRHRPRPCGLRAHAADLRRTETLRPQARLQAHGQGEGGQEL